MSRKIGGKDFEKVDIVFQSVGVCIDCTTAEELEYLMTGVCTLIFKFELRLRRKDEEIVTKAFSGSDKVEAPKFKALVKVVFDVHSQMELCSLRCI